LLRVTVLPNFPKCQVCQICQKHRGRVVNPVGVVVFVLGLHRPVLRIGCPVRGFWPDVGWKIPAFIEDPTKHGTAPRAMAMTKFTAFTSFAIFTKSHEKAGQPCSKPAPNRRWKNPN